MRRYAEIFLPINRFVSTREGVWRIALLYNLETKETTLNIVHIYIYVFRVTLEKSSSLVCSSNFQSIAGAIRHFTNYFNILCKFYTITYNFDRIAHILGENVVPPQAKCESTKIFNTRDDIGHKKKCRSTFCFTTWHQTFQNEWSMIRIFQKRNLHNIHQII